MAELRWDMRSQRAAQIFEALQGLDGHGGERAELRKADVPQHRIDALYPPNYVDLLAGLISYFERHTEGIAYSPSMATWLANQRALVDVAHRVVSREARNQWNRDGEATLHERIDWNKQFGWDNLSSYDPKQIMISDFQMIIWGAWWLTVNRKLITLSDHQMSWALLDAIHEVMLPHMVPEHITGLAYRSATTVMRDL